MAGLDIKLDRFDRVYRLGEQVQGLIAINAESGFAFNCIVLRAEGNMQFQMPSKGAGMLDSLVSSLKPVDLLQKVSPGVEDVCVHVCFLLLLLLLLLLLVHIYAHCFFIFSSSEKKRRKGSVDE